MNDYFELIPYIIITAIAIGIIIAIPTVRKCFIWTIFMILLLSGIVFIVFISLNLISSYDNNNEENALKVYHYLKNTQFFSYRRRFLNKGDKMPVIYNPKTKEEILEVLSNVDLMFIMMQTVIMDDMPCVSSFDFIDPNKNYTKFPNFILLNEHFKTPNLIGLILKRFESNNKFDYVQIMKKLIGEKTYHSDKFEFIFDPKILHYGSESTDVMHENNLCEFSSKRATFKDTIEASVIRARPFENDIKIQYINQNYSEDFAYCIQEHGKNINKTKC